MVAFLRAITFALQNFWRNIWLSIVTVVILMLSLFLISSLVGVRTVADQALNDVRSRVDIAVFFLPDAPESEILDLQARLERLPEIASVTYVSKDDALEAFREQIAGDSKYEEALESVGVNPLQASLQIRAEQLEQYPEILAVLNDQSYANLIEQDHAAESKLTFIEDFSQFTKSLSRASLWLTIIFALIAAMVVFNTIRITIYAYRTEINIMKLVGASNNFVRAPFIIESVLYALLAIVVTLLVLWMMIAFLAPFFGRLFSGFEVDIVQYLQSNFLAIFGPPALLLLGLAMISSGAAVGRYLRA